MLPCSAKKLPLPCYSGYFQPYAPPGGLKYGSAPRGEAANPVARAPARP